VENPDSEMAKINMLNLRRGSLKMREPNYPEAGTVLNFFTSKTN
jgi:hypothetical protein